MKNTNVILVQENINLYGDGYIEDRLGEYTFKISPLSFYQVNPIQAEKLYNLGVEMAQISKNDTVFDLYCGIGTISLFMAKYAKKVYGIEIVKEAVDAAKENAVLNGVNNTEFYAGDVEVVLDDLINNQGVKADIVMFDPPRKGLDKNSINFTTKGAYVVLDFGKELCGSIRFITRLVVGGLATFRITLGESMTEACSCIGEKNATKRTAKATQDLSAQVGDGFEYESKQYQPL